VRLVVRRPVKRHRRHFSGHGAGRDREADASEGLRSPQLHERFEVAVSRVGSDPFARRLDRERCEPGILHGVTRGVEFRADGFEDGPVAWPRRNEHGIGSLEQRATEFQHVIHTVVEQRCIR
jgi:hypothetical protein